MTVEEAQELLRSAGVQGLHVNVWVADWGEKRVYVQESAYDSPPMSVTYVTGSRKGARGSTAWKTPYVPEAQRPVVERALLLIGANLPRTRLEV